MDISQTKPEFLLVKKVSGEDIIIRIRDIIRLYEVVDDEETKYTEIYTFVPEYGRKFFVLSSNSPQEIFDKIERLYGINVNINLRGTQERKDQDKTPKISIKEPLKRKEDAETELMHDKLTDKTFDDFTTNFEGGLEYKRRNWTYLCSKCLAEIILDPNVPTSELFEHMEATDIDSLICGVVGCDNEAEVYYDFNGEKV